MNLRQLAKGRECQIRIPDVCCGDPATTVLCHVRMVGVSGLGLKSPDILGAWGCTNCHDAVDRRRYKDLEFDYVRLLHLQGMYRTIAKLIDEELIK